MLGLSILVTYFIAVIAHRKQKWLMEEFISPYSSRGIESTKVERRSHRQPEQETEKFHLQPHSESREQTLSEAINSQSLAPETHFLFPNISRGPGIQIWKPMRDISHINHHTEGCWCADMQLLELNKAKSVRALAFRVKIKDPGFWWSPGRLGKGRTWMYTRGGECR